MTTGHLLTGIMAAASAVAGGLLIALALMTAFAAVGQTLLLARRIRASRAKGAQGQAAGRRPATSGVVAD